jgi:hypothetical protein
MDMQLRLHRRRRSKWRKGAEELLTAVVAVRLLARALWRGWRTA